MIIVAFVFAIALCVVLAAVFSLSPMVWLALGIACVAWCLVVAMSNINRGLAKLSMAALGCVTLVGLVMYFHVSQFVEREISAPLREVESAQNAIDGLLASTDQKRFSKALTIAQALQNPDRKYAMTWQLHQKLADLSGAVALAETEIAAALDAARAVNACPEFVPAALARQIQPADLLRTLQKWPDSNDCQGADRQLVQRFTERCKGPMADRCANELSRTALLLASDSRYLVDQRFPNRPVGELTPRAYALRELIESVWPKQAD